MEFTEEQIAKLVLGYLKAEGCKHAAKQFVKSSRNLRKIASNYNKLYFSTRVGKLSLVDYLVEYAKISTIVQDRLEYTSYYSDNKDKTRQSLAEDLLYLLDNTMRDDVNIPSCATTPCPRTPTSELSVSNDSCINAAALEDLPGYNVFKTKLRNNRHKKKDHGELNLSVLTQTLLENNPLHENIAENINSFRNSAEGNSLQEEFTNSHMSQGTDSTIKSVIEKSINNPIYDKLVENIIGGVQENKSTEARKTIEGKSMSDTESYTKTIQKSCTNINNNKTAASISLHNTEATQAIIVAGGNSNYTKPQIQWISTPISKKSDFQKCLSINTNNGGATLSNNNLKKLIKSNDNQQIKNNLLMIKQKPVSITQTTTALENKGKSIFEMGGSIITEEDILKMPVILCNDPTVDPIPLIVPETKPHSSGLREYITMYKASADSPKVKIMNVDIIPSKNTYTVLSPQSQLSKLDEIPKTCEIKPGPLQSNLMPSTTMDKPISESNTITTTVACTVQKTPVLAATDKDVGKTSTKIQDSNKKIPTKTSTTPKNYESHVRVLDFNVTSAKKNEQNKSKCVLSLFGSERHKAEDKSVPVPKTDQQVVIKSWDADLRMLLPSSNREKTKPETAKEVVRKRKQQPSTKKNKKNKKVAECKNGNKPVANSGSVSIVGESINIETVRSVEEVNTGKELSATIIPSNSLNQNPDNRTSMPETERSASKSPESRKKSSVKLAIPTNIEMHTVDSTAKLVMSPTKLNANKRNILEMDKSDESASKCNTQNAEKVADVLLSGETNQIFGMNVQDKEMVNPNVELTECLQAASTSKPKSKDDLAFVHATPMKDFDVTLSIPKTPGLFSPLHVNDTPMTRVFKENLKGVDISDISTPKFPLTPSVEISPIIDSTHFRNRPTDYSTSSSYYQPSDTEENKCLEKKIIEECNKTGIVETKTVVQTKRKSDPLEKDLLDVEVDQIIADKMKKTISKKSSKNLNVMKEHAMVIGKDADISSSTLSSSSSSPSSSSSSSPSILSDSDFACNVSDMSISSPNKTIIEQTKDLKESDLKVGGYSLRSRNPSTSTKKQTQKSDDKVIEAKKPVALSSNKKADDTTADQKGILQEIEVKRQKFITNMLFEETRTKKTTKRTVGKHNMFKSKCATQKASVKNVERKPKINEENIKPIPESENKESVAVVAMSKTECIRKKEDESKKSDADASKLITNLQERGILLVPNGNVESESKVQEKKVEKPPTKTKNRRKSEQPKKKVKAPTTTTATMPMIKSMDQNKISALKDCEVPDQELKKDKKEDKTGTVTLREENAIDQGDLNLSVNHIEFEIKTYESETLHIVYDESKTSKRMLADYDLDCMKKGITASVYLEELDCEIEKCMLPTEFEFLSTPSDNNNKKSSGKNEKKIDKSAVKRKASTEMSVKTKKNKTDQELLQTIELEDFLNKLHGKEEI